jgi:hypothetical protein
MSHFILEGRLDIADGIVGTFPAAGPEEIDQSFILALIREGTSQKRESEIKEQIVSRVQPRFQQWNYQTDLSGLFNRGRQTRYAR